MAIAQPREGPRHPDEEAIPVFDRGEEDIPWPEDETLPIDDDGNTLPGNDSTDDDPNDNGDREGADPEDLPGEAGKRLDPNMSKQDISR